MTNLKSVYKDENKARFLPSMRFKVTKLELIARLPSALSAPAHFPGLPCSKSRTPCQPQGHQSPPQRCSKAGRWLPSAWPASEPGPSAGPHPIPALGSLCLQGSAQSTGKCSMPALLLMGWEGDATSLLPALPTGSPRCSWIPWQAQSHVLPRLHHLNQNDASLIVYQN